MINDQSVPSQSAEEMELLPQACEPSDDICRCRGLRLTAERAHRVYFVPVADVDYIEAAGNYVCIRVRESEYLRRDTLARLTRELRFAGFQRIHRTILMNFRHVEFAERAVDGAFVFTLTSGARLTSHTRFRLEDRL